MENPSTPRRNGRPGSASGGDRTGPVAFAMVTDLATAECRSRFLEPLFVGVVEKPRFHLVGVEVVEEASVDAHPAEILAERSPVGQTSTARAMVNSDHLIAPDICLRLTGHSHLVGPVISNQPVELAA